MEMFLYLCISEYIYIYINFPLNNIHTRKCAIFREDCQTKSYSLKKKYIYMNTVYNLISQLSQE